MSERSFIDKMMKYPNLSEQDFQSLFEKWKKYQDKEVRDKICLAYMKIVIKVASSYAQKTRAFRVEDLVTPGLEGLYRALEKFDGTKGTFGGYATRWVRAFVIKHIQDHARTVRLPVTAQIGRSKVPSTALVSGFSINQPVRGSENLFFDVKDNSVPDLDGLMTIDILWSHVQEILESFTERERHIIYETFFKQISLAEIAREYKVSRERIRQIQAKALSKIKSRMEIRGFVASTLD